ncbi:SDR family NAD(P)-dependent oxidoreductase [Mycobacterium parmense]|uniref:Short-chain dehydrogenase n=1 Tax=Mycobacterium parmense TaxID=185642 RepID=A0A7I7YSR9_9MYCO|nr:SDR family NAD(P)-dependent oxidoreductase [Mycobacterium parmense]MCV7348723.1 SDR family oxidoreductase [Mycobacterium parmense]ORW49603.1 short-chain dehydrogenase [Mycobacterium parmense]BBZ44232.1 short-chain dehydrogenase [Mycobacterium parmense]
MELQSRIALVTGGTAGIGLESARLLAAEGAEVVIAGRDAQRGASAVAEIGGKASFVQSDMADMGCIAELASRAGAVDILVNNAGAFPVAPTVEQDLASFEAMVDTNLRGTYFLVAELAKGMIARGRGSIVNVTSLAAVKGMPGASVYSATKAALASLTRTWAAEFGAAGVRVNSVSPGPTRTDGVLAEWGESIEDIGASVPLGRTASPAEIAQAVLFLASPRASYVTGSTLYVDGGGSAV